MTNSRARSRGCNLVILTMTTLVALKWGDGYSVAPFINYHLCMMNELSQDTLFLKCYSIQRQASSKANVDGLVIPAHSSYNWSFHTTPVGDLAYYCTAEWGTHHYATLFEAFIDRPAFVDAGCGGRHCIWKYADDGLYLYHIPSGDYKFMFPWTSQKI